MNAAAQVLPPKDIPVPNNLKKVEICTASGDLATDRCYDVVDGERRRTTFMTFATKEEVPTKFCPVHGGGRSSIGEYTTSRGGSSNGGAPNRTSADANAKAPPRAVPVANLDNVKPVQIKAPTVLDAGDHDPYDAVRPVVNEGGGHAAAQRREHGARTNHPR